MTSRVVVRTLDEVSRGKELALEELRREVWKAAFSEKQGVDAARVTVVKIKFGYEITAEL